ncbi:hypothetical protein [uncultured Clostridium sp.]|uniref:hypothetical protein n=1 Tax=uncultured Clostridium sp. TaxID=59620 RepID=UPI0028E68B04|nr:hypothetical protein [uncultured Clostridium sp.]
MMMLMTICFELPYQQVFAFDKASLESIYVSEENYEEEMKDLSTDFLERMMKY